MISRVGIVVLTGLSGAGKTSALKSFEDIEYYPIDNLPVSMIGSVADAFAKAESELSKIVLVVDARTRGVEYAHVDVQKVKDKYGAKVVFLESTLETIVKRYKSTRHLHPQGIDIEKAYNKEVEILKNVREMSDMIIDTSEMTVHDLSRKIKEFFSTDSDILIVNIMSFGFKHGSPRDSDILLDVRFLRNPFFIDELKDKTGVDSAVQQYVQEDEDFKKYLKSVLEMLEVYLKRSDKDKKTLINIAIGCTGGKHRSVTFAEKLYQELKNIYPYKFSLNHIDKDRA